MEIFLKKNSLLIPVIVVSVLVAIFFTADNQRLRVLASVVTAKQLISENSNKISSLTGQQKIDLIKRIDEETSSLGVDYSAVNKEIQSLKKDKQASESQLASFSSQISYLTAQISANQNRVSNLRNRQQNLNEQYKNRIRQCGSGNANQKAACRNQAQNINSNINDIKKQITQTQSTITGLQRQLAEFQYKTNPITNEIKSISLNISAKEKIAREMFTVIQSLGKLRTDVVNSTNNNDDDNDDDDERDIEGCTDGMASNWNSSATVDDGSCEYKNEGCTDELALNYNHLAIDDDGSCEYEQKSDCLCETEETTGGEENEAEKVTKVRVNITQFGGPDDKVMTATETLSVGGGVGRELDPDDIYTAWPMPGINEDNPDSPFDLPNVESCFGPETESWKGEQIARANEALDKHYAEISYTDSNGNKKTVRARIVDRGPGISTRWDASRGLWNALGLNAQLGGSPNDPNNMVDLEIKLVPKDGGSCSTSS